MNVKQFTDEQLRLYEALTKLQKGVALNTLAGMKPADAHRAAGGTCRNEANRYKLAGEILIKPTVVDFLTSFKVAPSQEIAPAIASRDDILRDLTEISKVTINDVASFSERPLVDMENGMEVLTSRIHIRSMSEIPPEAMKAIKSVKQTKHGLEVTLHDTMAARKQISEMCGYNAPTKTELSGPDGKPIQTQDIPDEDIEEKMRSLGLGRYHNQLGAKRVDN